MNPRQILPGSTIGILGAGQIAKMMCEAAHRMGYYTYVWGPESVATHIATKALATGFDCTESFTRFLEETDVITTEWESVPAKYFNALAVAGGLVRPSKRVMEIAQHRGREKRFVADMGIPTVPFAVISSGVLAERERYEGLFPGILKTSTGYDGKGQEEVKDFPELLLAIGDSKEDFVLERKVSFDYELSVLVSRNERRPDDGGIAYSPAILNEHENGILRRSTWHHGIINREVEHAAQVHALNLAHALNLHGQIVVEYFGRDGQPVFNEFAPRPHNSFHATIEVGSNQYEQHIRAICNLPMRNMRFDYGFEMTNIIGKEAVDLKGILSDPHASVHLYGKEVRPDRKMGHVTRRLLGR